MRKIVVITQVALDGVMQAPGGPEEDPGNGFKVGGWAMPFMDGSLNIVETDGEYDLLLGRRTYDIFAGYWPHQDNAIAKAFNRATKYVATHRSDHLDWQTSVRLGGDVVEEVRRLKASDGPEIAHLGQRQIAANADRRRSHRRIPHRRFSGGAWRRKAVIRGRPSAARSHAGQHAKIAGRRPLQHLPSGRSSPEPFGLTGNACRFRHAPFVVSASRISPAS